MRRLLLLVLLLAPLARVNAQAPGTCALGVAEGVLDVNQVRAALFNRGNLFFGNQTVNADGYLVPKESGRSPFFAMRLWAGSRVGGDLRVSGGLWTGGHFWPGPLGEGAVLPNPADCSAYDRIFVVSREDVRRYLETGVATDDLRDWPVAWGAPVLDGDGIDGNYDLEGGDQPAIYGDQTAWWVMNDAGNVHAPYANGLPAGLEVTVTAFAVASGLSALRRATYYRYTLTNRNTVPLDSAYVGFFVDVALGDASDDYVGSDTTLSMGFVYNGSDSDYLYGTPPAAGVQVVQGPIGLPNGRDDDGDGIADQPGERLKMTANSHFIDDFPGARFTYAAAEVYSRLRGRWTTGEPITEGGYGYESGGDTLRFTFPGDPVATHFWSEVNADGKGTPRPPSDRSFMIGTGPFRLLPGERTEVVFALPFAQGRDHLDSVAQLRYAAHAVKAAWDLGALAPSRVEATQSPHLPPSIEVTRPAPNPFTDRLTLSYTLPEALAVRVAVLDVLGREVAVIASGTQSAGPHEVEWDAADFPAGIYLVRVEAAGEARTFPLTKRR